MEALAETVLACSPAQLETFASSLDPGDLLMLEQALGARLSTTWRRDPCAMAVRLTRDEPPGPTKVEPWPYAQLLGEKFRQAADGEDTRQIWNLPTQYGKSTMGSQWGPGWYLDRYPSHRLILTSYGDELSRANGLAVRDILDRHAGVLRCRLRRDVRRQDRFRTEEGGGLLAAGFQSGATGWPAHGVVIDDPFKDWQQAHSDARRAFVWNQYLAVFRQRLTSDDAFIIVVMTRWHGDDLTGKLVQAMLDGNGEEWTVVRVPEIAEPPPATPPTNTASDYVARLPDPLGRKPGELLEPRRFSAKFVRDKHLTLGSYLVAGMAQQRPSPEEGVDVKRAWWQLEDRLPTDFDDMASSWDMKLKDKEGGDYVAGGAWGRTGKDAWLVDVMRGQWPFAITVNAIALMQVRHPNLRYHLIENTGNGPEVITELRMARPEYVLSLDVASQLGMTEAERAAVEAMRRRGMSGLIPITVPQESKRSRMRAVTPSIEAGDVHLPAYASWLGSYLEELSAFPNGTHDDQVDFTSQLLSRWLGATGHLYVPT